MSSPENKFKIFQKTLKNGLTVLVKPSHHIPRVEAHLWYNVGSKDEGHKERGMAHLIEHMLFKGTKKFSESDINLICQKLTGDANAFTSQDYTCYTFRLPSHVWEVALEAFAECMQHARFEVEMLASELKAVIEELRMYKEDFQGVLIENVVASMFSEHPYQYPIIGSKFDLCDLDRDTLYAFYKKHYHPGNAVLVVTGDIKHDVVFEAAEKHFGLISSPSNYQKTKFHIQDDLLATTTMLFRPTNTPWYCFAFKVPGLQEGKNHLIDIASLILATGKSSRLYQRLVNKEKVAIDVECSVFDFFEKGMITFGVWPAGDQEPSNIEAIIHEEFDALSKKQVHDWEFEAAKKRTQVDFTSLLESSEKQAFVIGNSFIATQDAHFIDKYLNAISKTTKKELQAFFKETFNISQQHKGYLLPLQQQDIKKLIDLQQESEKLEQIILHKHQRTKPVEEGRWVHSIPTPPLSSFAYPKPKTFTLNNGLDVIYHHNPLIPQVVCILSFKANYLYESDNHSGGFGFLLRTITDSTQQHGPDEFAKFLEMQGIYLGASGDNIVIRCLRHDLEKALKILADILINPAFNKHSIEKIRQQIICELEEFWQSPIDFIDQLAKEVIYQNHPYHKHPHGTIESIKNITKKDLESLFKTLLSPHQANLVIVGDFDHHAIQDLTTKVFKHWQGPHIADLTYPPLPQHKSQLLSYPLNRDQVALCFVAPSVSRKHPDYNALSLLDTVITGGALASPSSLLFQLREKTGLFYTIGGSMTYGSREEPGMAFIKTIVAADKVENAKKMILETIDIVGNHGITLQELEFAKNLYFAASIELFESNVQMAQTFLFLKKLHLSFNLFDKQGEILSIIKVDQVNEIAKRYCKADLMTMIQIGRIAKTKNVLFKKGEPFRKETNHGSKKSYKEKSS